MVITTSVETSMGYGYIVIQVVYWVELPEQMRLLDFCENMNPDKWNTTIWYRVIRNPQEFHMFTSYQQDPRDLRRHKDTTITRTENPYLH